METTKLCPVCDDTGWKTIGQGRDRRVTRCDCRRQGRDQKLLEQARIPKRYEDREFANFSVPNGQYKMVLEQALLMAQAFANEYPICKTGLLFVGSVGTGKTHLAVSIIKELIRKSVPCLFCDYRELLKQIQNSYNPSVPATEIEILRPTREAEILVVDELGAVRPSEWVWDTVSLLLNERYNQNLTTIITTNYPDESPSEKTHESDEQVSRGRNSKKEDRETLGDRIGERMRSRLHEMCKVVKMEGEDFRTKYRSASFR
jgi:DNA replication protein DnaC